MEIAIVSRFEEIVDTDQGKHDQGTSHRAQLLHSSVPHESAVTMTSEDHPQHHLDITDEASEEYP